MRKHLIIRLMALTVIGLIMLNNVSDKLASSQVELPIASLFPGDLQMWEHIFTTDGEYKFESAPLGVILPHHLIAATQLAKFYKGLSKVIDPKVIVIIGPNHYESGQSEIQTCQKCSYKTVYGDVGLETKLSNTLVENHIADFFDKTFIKEHAIYAHTPFIKKFFPRAKIVPIVLQWKIPKEKVLKLTEWLNKNLPADSLVIASVDFSHYIPVEAADFHDVSAFATISNFDFENVYNLEIDSPSSIYAILDLMKKRGYQKAERLEHTNLAQFLTRHEEKTTSHQFFSFFKGDPKKVTGVTVMSFGNIDVEQEVLKLEKGWNWDRKYDQSSDNSVKKFLRDIKGSEDRFLEGSDFLAYDLQDGGCEIQIQNESKIAFCKFDEKDDLVKFSEEIIKAKNESDIVYVQINFVKTAFLSQKQSELVKKLMDSGANVVIGKGVEKIVPLEVYNGGLIFYSLGSFISRNNSEGIVLGLHLSKLGNEVYIFPVRVTDSYPKLMDFVERQKFFRDFVEKSSLTDKAQVDYEKGVVKISR